MSERDEPQGLPAVLAWAVLSDTPNAVWVVDAKGELLWRNEAAADFLVATSGSDSGNIFDKLPPDKAQHRRLMVSAVRRSGKPVDFVDQHHGWWEVSIRPTDVPDVFVFWQRNVDRRVAAEEDLRRALSRAVTIQEDERRRISRDLHDETGQALTGLMLELRELTRRVEDPDLQARSERAATIAAGLMRQMRSILHQLNPPSLKTKPFKEAMAEYCALFSDRTGIKVRFEAGAPPKRLTDDQSTTLYRLLQEALTNVARHAAATTVWVSLSAEDGDISLSIEDDGVGFDASTPSGTGLLGIRERFAMLDGVVEIETVHGGGVRLEGTLPMHSGQRGTGK